MTERQPTETTEGGSSSTTGTSGSKRTCGASGAAFWGRRSAKVSVRPSAFAAWYLRAAWASFDQADSLIRLRKLSGAMKGL